MSGRPTDRGLVGRAAEFCRRAHKGQTSDDGEPFCEHPVAVAEILRRYGVKDSCVLAAAYLHDVLEDTSVTVDELAAEFGTWVTSLVQELTNAVPPGRTAQHKHAALLKKASGMSDDARLIKLADRLHNVSRMDVWPRSKRRRYAQQTIELLEALQPWPLASLAAAVRAAAEKHL